MPKRKEVDDWFATYDGPMKPAMLRVREIILGADARMDECIKWQTPTFTYEGNLASFNPRSKKAVSLLFHTGAQIPGTHPRLVGGGETARYMNVADVAEANAAKRELEAIVKAWCAARKGSGSAVKTSAKTATKRAAKGT